MQYLMIYIDEHDYSRTERYKIVIAEPAMTWRQLQQKFDPGYHYDNLQFFILGERVLK